MTTDDEARTPDDLLRQEAEEIKDALAQAVEAVDAAHARRVDSMKRMHEQKFSWAAIGRIYAVTPQAAMYATGAAKRTPRKTH